MPHLDSRRRAHAALNLRGRMRTWQEIADELNFQTADGARLAVRRLRLRDAPTVEERRAESAEELRVTRRMMIDHLEVAHRNGDADAVTRLAREIRANLDSEALRCGLNAPQRTEVDVKLDPGELVGQWFKSLRAGGRPALPSSVLDVEVVEQ
jgi:hypothetical protein